MSERLSDRSTLALIKGKPVRYRVRRSRRARKMGVQVCKRDGVVIVLPQRVGLKVVPELLEHWADWIDAKADEYGVRHGPRIRQYATGSEILVLGRPRVLRITNLPPDRKRPVIDLEDASLSLALSPSDVFEIRPVLEKYLRRLARKDLTERISQGRGYAYRAVVTETELATQRLNDTLAGVADRPSLLAGFVDSLSADDQQHLRTILGELDQS